MADTAEACGKVTPLDYKGRLTFWYQGVFEGDPDLLRQYYKDFFEAFRKTYPNIELEEQALKYNDLLDKFRTALLGNAAPMAVRLQILGGTEFAGQSLHSRADRGRHLRAGVPVGGRRQHQPAANSDVEPDDQVWLEFDQNRMHLFDGETELALKV